tara:strand:- start:167 stop:439 length:273 start_codon:yes stop_codon:yes gene_type:complete
MSRYQNTKVEKTINNTTAYNTTIYQDIPQRDDDIVVITQEGDRLDLLANQFYQNQSLWWYIAQANNLNTMNVQPGVTLRIPATTEFAEGK